MFKLKSQYKIPADVKTVFTIMRDEFKDYWKDLPNIQSFKVLEEKNLKDKKKLVKIEWTGKAPIPALLKHLLSPKMLKWVDRGVWDEKDFTLIWESKTYFYSDIFTCRGNWYIKKDGKHKNSSLVILDGFIDIAMPVFGMIAEKIVAKYLMENLKKAEKNLIELVNGLED